MTIMSKAVSAVKSFSGKPLGVISKALGAVSIASVIYDSHVNGRENAIVTDRTDSADRFDKQYSQYMSYSKGSATISKLKKIWYDTQQGFTYTHMFSRLKGYTLNFGKTLASGLPIVALSVIALKFKTLGKAAGIILLANALKTLIYDVAGFGDKKVNK